METVPIIIYAKENQIKALSVNDSLRLDDDLKSNGWKQTKAIDATRWIQKLHNNLVFEDVFDCINIIQEIESLSKKY
jgi:hypothetical protein